jgi:hypothetical protein
VLAEEAERRRFDAVEAVAEIHLVQVQLEDLVLGELTLDPPREHRLFQLAPQRLVGREKALARELLRQRAAALRRAVRAKVVERRGHHANHVDAAVIVETLILDGNDRVHHVGRDLRQRRLDAPLLEDRERRTIVAVVSVVAWAIALMSCNCAAPGRSWNTVYASQIAPARTMTLISAAIASAARNAPG